MVWCGAVGCWVTGERSVEVCVRGLAGVGRGGRAQHGDGEEGKGSPSGNVGRSTGAGWAVDSYGYVVGARLHWVVFGARLHEQ